MYVDTFRTSLLTALTSASNRSTSIAQIKNMSQVVYHNWNRILASETTFANGCIRDMKFVSRPHQLSIENFLSDMLGIPSFSVYDKPSVSKALSTLINESLDWASERMKGLVNYVSYGANWLSKIDNAREFLKADDREERSQLAMALNTMDEEPDIIRFHAAVAN